MINCQLLIINLHGRKGGKTTLSTLYVERLRRPEEKTRIQGWQRDSASLTGHWPTPRPKPSLKRRRNESRLRHTVISRTLGFALLWNDANVDRHCQTTPLCHHQGLALSQYAARQGEISEIYSRRYRTNFQPGQTTELLLCLVQLAGYDWSRPSRRRSLLTTLLQSARAEFF